MTASAVEVDREVRVSRVWNVPYAPPSLNVWQSAHWARKKATKDAWYEFAWGLQNSAPTRLPTARFVYVTAEVVFRKGAHRDQENYAAVLWKIVGDMLQHVHVIKDDTAREFEVGPIRLVVAKDLKGLARDPRQQGATRLAIVAVK